jgi:DNA-binding GntR family transcriptional regulator
MPWADQRNSFPRNDRETTLGQTDAMKSHVKAEIRVPKTAELVASEIRNGILVGSLQPGDRLPAENSLMSSFGVSRPSLREALRLLEAEELLDIRRGARGGAVVRRPSALPALRAAAAWLALGDAETEGLRDGALAGGDPDLMGIAERALRTALRQARARAAA